MTPRLETRRLILRLPAPSDAPAVVRHLNNFAVAGNLTRVPYPYAAADAEAWLDQQRADRAPEDTQFAIELKGAGYIGQVGFHTDVCGPVIGYWLGEPFWHRGIMTEAAGAALDWYFDASAAELIRSGVFAFNRASLAVQKKLGFTVTGASTRHCLARREELRHIDTELSRAAWAERRARVPAQLSSSAPVERATNGVKP